uniref:Uncharacterized protein n=1 Tax=Dulem virus 36 TaxID=3145754 RepID=A0AAU8B119_9CAUD
MKYCTHWKYEVYIGEINIGFVICPVFQSPDILQNKTWFDLKFVGYCDAQGNM